ncbi:MAG TPA: complex I subunit 1 family protein [Haliangiales bacterium]|nr:complex I subunit 1 family protein [Haliangiales bacterium]
MAWYWSALWAAVKWLGLIMLFVMPVASLLTWAERRQSAMMQDRLGPNRANIGKIRLWGILHFVADALKMLFKEDFVPAKAQKFLFFLAPILAIAPVFIVFSIIPFGPPVNFHKLAEVMTPTDLDPTGVVAAGGEPLQVFVVEFGILFYFAISSLANYGVSLAGWASYNKYSLLGGLRASSQMMAYEVAMGLAVMGMFLVTGTLEPGAMVAWQAAHTWGVVAQPLAFILFFTAAIAETKRAPFDIPEGEPEIVGYFIEYSGMRFGIFFLAEFIEIVFVAAMVTTVFFGGWDVPFLHADGWHFFGVQSLWPHGLVALTQLVFWTIKVIFFCWLQLLIRWTLPRFRPDQLMRLGWTKLLPLSLVNIMATAVVLYWNRG